MNRELNYRYRRFVLGTLRKALELRARISGKRFYCGALAGEVRDGIFVNSDMTVSCNCQDIDGAGQIGNLRTTPFEEIFAGLAAGRLRRSLAAGKLPIDRCAACFHVRMASAPEAESQVTQFQMPPGLSVENTVHCNLRCLSCCRHRILQTRKDGRALSLEDFEIVGRTLARLGATYCGFYNLGEPFLSQAIGRELATLRRHCPDLEILVSTNGLLVDSDEKREAALLVDHLLFSIDGIDTPMVRRYQRGGDFDRAYGNLRDLVAFRNRLGLRKPRIDWKYVVFRWNHRPEHIRRAIERAGQAGADNIQFTFARTPAFAISWRFLLSPFFRSLGVPDGWRSRVVRLGTLTPVEAPDVARAA